MSPLNRRRFLCAGLGDAACTCVLPRLAIGQAIQPGAYICPPCGCAMDGKDFTAPGICPACNMALVPKPGPPAMTDETVLTVEPVRSDFCQLYAGLQAAHYDLYAHRSKADYDALFQSMRIGFDKPLPRVQVQVAFQRFVAFGRVAHAHMEFPQAAFDAYRNAGGRYFPLGVRIADQRLYIAQNYSGLLEATPGVEILAIEGWPTAQVLDALGRHISADTDYLTGALIEQRFNALLWLEWGPREAFALDLEAASRRQLVVPARTRSEVRAAALTQPDSFAPDGYSRDARLIGDIAYMRPGPFMNTEGGLPWDTAPFATFVDKAFDGFLAAKAKALIIDLRANPGGDALFSNLMIRWFADKPFKFYSTFRLKASAISRARTEAQLEVYADHPESPVYGLLKRMRGGMDGHKDGETFTFNIPDEAPRTDRRFTGRVLVLTDRQTFSNATAVAALIQDYGFGRIAGEVTADLPSGFGASETFELPGTGLLVTFPKSWFVRPNGDAGVRGVMPDFPIPIPIVEAPEDTVLKAAVGLLAV